MTRWNAWFLGFGIALTFYWGAATLSGFDWKDGYRIARGDARTAMGIVTATNPGQHCEARFRFVVGGTEYNGVGHSCSRDVGDAVQVYYMPDYPGQYSTLSASQQDIRPFLIGTIAFSTIAGFLAMAKIGTK
jgi:hypothetical protein